MGKLVDAPGADVVEVGGLVAVGIDIERDVCRDGVADLLGEVVGEVVVDRDEHTLWVLLDRLEKDATLAERTAILGGEGLNRKDLCHLGGESQVHRDASFPRLSVSSSAAESCSASRQRISPSWRLFLTSSRRI